MVIYTDLININPLLILLYLYLYLYYYQSTILLLIMLSRFLFSYLKLHFLCIFILFFHFFLRQPLNLIFAFFSVISYFIHVFTFSPIFFLIFPSLFFSAGWRRQSCRSSVPCYRPKSRKYRWEKLNDKWNQNMKEKGS